MFSPYLRNSVMNLEDVSRVLHILAPFFNGWRNVAMTRIDRAEGRT